MGWLFYFLILQREEIVEIKALKPMERSHTFITQSFTTDSSTKEMKLHCMSHLPRR